jgi:hypothetical protein
MPEPDQHQRARWLPIALAAAVAQLPRHRSCLGATLPSGARLRTAMQLRPSSLSGGGHIAPLIPNMQTSLLRKTARIPIAASQKVAFDCVLRPRGKFRMAD